MTWEDCNRDVAFKVVVPNIILEDCNAVGEDGRVLETNKASEELSAEDLLREDMATGEGAVCMTSGPEEATTQPSMMILQAVRLTASLTIWHFMCADMPTPGASLSWFLVLKWASAQLIPKADGLALLSPMRMIPKFLLAY